MAEGFPSSTRAPARYAPATGAPISLPHRKQICCDSGGRGRPHSTPLCPGECGDSSSRLPVRWTSFFPTVDICGGVRVRALAVLNPKKSDLDLHMMSEPFRGGASFSGTAFRGFSEARKTGFRLFRWSENVRRWRFELRFCDSPHFLRFSMRVWRSGPSSSLRRAISRLSS